MQAESKYSKSTLSANFLGRESRDSSPPKTGPNLSFSSLHLTILWLLCGFSNGFSQTYSFDPSGRISKITLPTGQTANYHYDRAGNLLQVTPDVTAPPAITNQFTLTGGMESGINLSGGRSLGGHAYGASGLPAGLRVDPVTGRILGTVTGIPGTYTVSYWTQMGTVRSTTQQFTLEVTAFPQNLTGSFDSLLLGLDNVPTGKIDVLVSTTGAFTGRLNLQDGGSYALRGAFQVVSAGNQSAAAVTLSRGSALPPLVVDLAIQSNGTFTSTVSARQIKLATSSNGAKRGSFSATNPAPWRGTYTMTLEGAAWVPNAPEGLGYASVTINDSGVMTVRGRNSDGSPLSGTFHGSATGNYPVFCYPYQLSDRYVQRVVRKKNGRRQTIVGYPYLNTDSFVGGAVKMALSSGRYRATTATGSELHWKKASYSGAGSYRDGFGALKIFPTMLPWTPPAPGQSLATLLGLPSSGEFGATIQGSGLDNLGVRNPNPAGSPSVPAGSNHFATRAQISADGGTGTSGNRYATKEAGEPNHAGNTGGRSLWWQWTPTRSGTAQINTNGSTFDTVLAVYRGSSLSALTLVTSDDDSGTDSQSLVSISVTAGTTYLIAVDGYGGAYGTVTLNVTAPVGTSNGPMNFYNIPAWLSLNLQNQLGTAENGATLLTGSVDPATGVFKAVFSVKDVVVYRGRDVVFTRNVPFEGVFLNNPGGVLGGGFFLLPSLNAWETQRSGLGVFSTTPPRARY